MKLGSRAERKVAAGVTEDVFKTLFNSERAYREMLEERDDTAHEEIRDEAMLHAGSLAETALETLLCAKALRRALPEEAKPRPAVELIQTLAESFVLMAHDAYDDALPDADRLTVWLSEPLIVQWLSVAGGTLDHALMPILEDVHAGRRPLVEDLSPERNERAARDLAGIVRPLLGAYREIFAAYVAGSDVATAAMTQALAAARVLREVKDDCALIAGFDEDVQAPLVVCAVLFQSLVMIARAEDASFLVQLDQVDVFDEVALAPYRRRLERAG